MWPGDDGIELAAEGEEDVDVDDGSLSKRELVDGLIGAVSCSYHISHPGCRRADWITAQTADVGRPFTLTPPYSSGPGFRARTAYHDLWLGVSRVFSLFR